MPNLEVTDFTGGITDNFIAAPINAYREADNLYVADDRYAYTRPALVLSDREHPRVPTLERISKQFVVDDVFVSLSGRQAYYKNSTGFNEILGPTGNPAFDAFSNSAKFSVAKQNDHYYVTSDQLPSLQAITKDGNSWVSRTLGLPTPDISAVVLTSAAGGGPYSYVFQWKLTYTVNGVTYEERSQYSDIRTIENDLNVTITGLPVFTNTSSSNYDTANLTLLTYRTTTLGNIFYLIKETANGVTTFVDSTTDEIAEESLDVIDVLNISADITPTPKAKYIHATNDILWLAQPSVGGVVEKSKLRHSIRFQAYNCPGDFEEDFEDEITGLSSVNVYPIVFTKNSIFRIEGYYQANGSGGIAKRRISDIVGCVSNDSIVQIDGNKLAFAGENGFYITDGFTVNRISDAFSNTYRTFVQNDTQKKNIYGCFDELGAKILWSVQSVKDNDYADKIFVCHLKWQNLPFTTWSGGKVDPQNFRPSCITYHNDKVYVGDDRGYALNFSFEDFSDDRIEINADVDDWVTSTILYRYVSPSYDFGTPTLRKWVTWLVLNLDNASSVSLQASLANDNSGLFKNLAEIKYKSNIAWEDDDIEWEDDSLRWDYTPTIATKRRIPSSNRCSYKQLMLENSYSTIDTSERAGQCVVDADSNTATLTGLEEWPSNCVDYYLEITIGGILSSFKILSNTDTVLTLEDLSSQLISGTYDWEIKGYRRDEILKLIEYTLVYTPVSMSQEPHTTGAS